MGLGIPPLETKLMLESNPLKSTMLVGRLGVVTVHMFVVLLLCYLLLHAVFIVVI